MRTTLGPVRLIVMEIDEHMGFSVYRIVRSNDADDPVFLNSLKSHYELGDEPRRHERSSTAIHMGISVFLDFESAHGTATRFRRLGDYVAQLDLSAGFGINVAQTGHPLHLTMWADPIKLSELVVDIRPVAR